MAITNGEIILRESLELLKQGVLKPTGRVFIQELPDGSKIELPEPEPIHTYNGWKELGYQVKKGEHAKAQFPIWKYKGQKNEETGEEEGGNLLPAESVLVYLRSGGKGWLMNTPRRVAYNPAERISDNESV